MELADAVQNTLLGVCRSMIAAGVDQRVAVRIVVGAGREATRVLEQAQAMANRRDS